MKDEEKMKQKRIRMLGIMACAGIIACSGMTAAAAPLLEDNLNVELVQNGGVLTNINAKYPAAKLNGSKAHSRQAFPEKFDLRNVEGKNYVTPVKFQNPWGTCWAFSDIASLESNVIMQGAGTAEKVDYSEKALVWYSGQLQRGQDDTGEKEGIEYIAEDLAMPYLVGGTVTMVAAQMSSGIGTSTEEQVPYRDKDGTMQKGFLNGKEVYWYDPLGDWTLDDSHLYDRAYQLKNMQYLFGYSAFASSGMDKDELVPYVQDTVNPRIKALLMDRGAVGIGFCADEASPDEVGTSESSYFNAEHNAQYNPDNGLVNHSVTIVGWDDSYPKENFSIAPPGDGAWIVKNSWSDAWGDEGYFYLSYYDTTIAGYESLEADVESFGYSGYDHNYQYDYLGNKSAINASVEASISQQLAALDRDVKAANIFQAKGNETLRAVGVNDNVCWDEDATVVTEIYKLKDNSNPENGELVSSQTDTVSNMLYAAIELKEPVELKEGEYFSVVQSIRTESGLRGVPVEIGTSEPITVSSYDGNGYQISYTVKSEPGQSFLWGLNDTDEEQEWQDVTGEEIKATFKASVTDDADGAYTIPGNVMIKAYTVDTDTTLSMSNHTVDILCYDSSGRQIARLENADITAALELPWNTDSIAFLLEGENEDNLQMKADGMLLKDDAKISRKDFENAKETVLVLTGQDRGESADRVYPITLIFGKQPETEDENKDTTTTVPDGGTGGEKTDGSTTDSIQNPENMSGTKDVSVPDETLGSAADVSKTGDAGRSFAWSAVVLAAGAASAVLVMIRRKIYGLK